MIIGNWTGVRALCAVRLLLETKLEGGKTTRVALYLLFALLPKSFLSAIRREREGVLARLRCVFPLFLGIEGREWNGIGRSMYPKLAGVLDMPSYAYLIIVTIYSLPALWHYFRSLLCDVRLRNHHFICSAMVWHGMARTRTHPAHMALEVFVNSRKRVNVKSDILVRCVLWLSSMEMKGCLLE